MAQGTSIPRIRRRSGEILMSIGAIGVVLIVLIAFDGNLRDEITRRVTTTNSPVEMIDGGGHLREALAFGIALVKSEFQLHPLLLLFVGAAAVLTLFMLRT